MKHAPRPLVFAAALGVAWTVIAPYRTFGAAPDASDSESPGEPASSASAAEAPRPWADDAPAAADAPQMRNVEPRTSIYVDGSFAQTPDLSALPNIAGHGRNLRASVGGTLKWHRFQFDTELPASQATTLHLLDPNAAIVIAEEDRDQTSLSIGDLRVGAQWTDRLPVDALPLVGGFGLRVRVPTHTTAFQFHNLIDGSLNTYVLPYYFHIHPTLLLGGALGALSFVTNQGGLILMGPDGKVQDLQIVVPTIYFWDAHYAVAYRIAELVGVSVEVNTTIQLNDLDPVMFPKLSHLRAVSILPDIQLHFGDYRVDALARIGVSRGADAMGVLGYAGTRSFIVRVTRTFDSIFGVGLQP
jgi:hypothetical protein